MNPIHFLHEEHLSYNLDGIPVLADSIHLPPEACGILCTVPIEDAQIDEKDFAKAIAFAKQRTANALHWQLGEDFHQENQDSDDDLGEPFDKAVSPNKKSSRYKELYDELYWDYYDNSYDENHKIIQQFVDKWIDEITPQKALDDSLELRKQRLKEFPNIEPEYWNEIVEKIMEKNITNSFLRMPEWAQILTHQSGMYVSTTSLHKRAESEEYESEGFSVQAPNNTFFIYINSDSALDGSKARLDPVLREELLHSLHADNVGISLVCKWAANELLPGMPVDSDDADSLYWRWNTQAYKLIKEIDANNDHPAIKLIERSETGGGSLTSLKKSQGSADQPSFWTPQMRADELLVDIFDAEIVLRQKDGKTKLESEKIMRAAFGDAAYSTAYEYLDAWKDRAEKLLAKEIGEEKAHERRLRWDEDPFGHNITITKLPAYRADSVDLPPH